ncbi:MAG: hypothetical protein N7Q72_03270, partial [Spiroplasma sp. Tabriz.8]|nr:hypothetical protein [Spiroplasma sp. Tabriz.8]
MWFRPLSSTDSVSRSVGWLVNWTFDNNNNNNNNLMSGDDLLLLLLLLLMLVESNRVGMLIKSELDLPAS